MNRGLDYAASILARKYPDPFTRNTTIQTVAGQKEYDIPEDCSEDRVLRVEVAVQGTYQELRRISPYDVGQLEVDGVTSTPQYYAITERKIYIVPGSDGSYSLRVWYFRNPESLVLPQGRITAINTGSKYILVDAVGTDISTESDTLESYCNLVDAQTGIIKASLQIQSIDDNRITFRSTPIRSSVMNRDIGDEIPATVQLDDQICLASGTCVPEFSQPTTNFLIQYAVAEIVRSKGGDAPTEEAVLKKFEAQLEKTWGGRETTTRIKLRNPAWGSSMAYRRRWPYTMK